MQLYTQDHNYALQALARTQTHNCVQDRRLDMTRPVHVSILCTVDPQAVSSYLWQLFGYISPHKHSLQVDPEVLHCEPVLNDV